MYILDFLRPDETEPNPDDAVSVEYRLLCSGELYNGDVVTADWRETDAARCILPSPFSVTVASRPFGEFPQELALRFTTHLVTEQRDHHARSFYPDDEIAADLAALLTVFCRRLVTVSAKTRELYPDPKGTLPAWIRDTATGFVNSLKKTHWERYSAVLMEGPAGTEVYDYNPKPMAISPGLLRSLLLTVPGLPHNDAFIEAARLYAAALERMRHDVGPAYQLLVASIETLANTVLSEWRPEDQELVRVKSGVLKRALEYGLNEQQANDLAVEACKGLAWHKRKFSKFVLEYNTADLTTEDDLFANPDYAVPDTVDMELLLDEVYSARGGASHSGKSFPAVASAGLGPMVSMDLIWELMTSKESFTPITQFERVVNSAIVGYVQSHLA